MPHKHIIRGQWTGKWIGQVKRQGTRTRKLFDRKDEAKAWEVEHKRQGSVSSTPIVTVCLIDWSNAYLDYCLRYVAKTYSEKHRVLRRLCAAFGPETPVHALTAGQALTYLQRQFRQRSGYAANKERKNLLAAWTWGRRYLEGFPTGSNPFLVDKFPEERHPRYMPSVTDFLKVLAGAEGQEKVLLLTFALTAARRGEVYRLQWADVDFARQRLRLTTRKRQGGSMAEDWFPLSDELAQALLEHRKTAQDPWVFTQQDGRRKGKPYGEYRGFPQTLCQRAGVRPFGCHAIRHLTASLLAQHNTPLGRIREFLRHTRLGTTEKYVQGLESLRPYLRILEGGLLDGRSHTGTPHTKQG